MLDVDTKLRIDEARDILVGKIPDPKSQVEQITIALIYKFMNDIDSESEGLGGERLFFAGEFDKYRWANLVHAGLGGYEMLNLYAEALTRIPENPNIPPLFREIFNNVYLPYRDPETLRMFFNVIDDFTYDHSERLGDAFEHLLSVLGSQGDAGQFRTPRHIIDFMVKIIDPQKDERVLDPACGTAGFLISAYKHIRTASSNDAGRPTLTPDEHARLVKNLVGYDISPDMVRLSLVNMYLHGFPQPSIHEYDTLTSEERWEEYADVILANPPFMSPRGGIRPHNRFSMRSSRSEVLFVDYIAEHLSPDGRAAVIVPEGIIFQSQRAHTQLRKMLTEEYLVAVVSLPPGVFNPYSGVKTSILIMDKSLARRTNQVAFFKVLNDGYDLGAQRRRVKENDLPIIRKGLTEFLYRIRASESLVNFQPELGIIVDKALILADDEYSINLEQYRKIASFASNWESAEVGEICDVLDSLRKPITKQDRKSGPHPYYGATGVVDWVADYIFDEPLVLVGEDGAKWRSGEHTAFHINGKTWVNNHAHVLRPNRDMVLDTFLIAAINHLDLTPYITGITVPKLNQRNLRRLQIPLPPLEMQREIVAEIESYQRVIDGAQAVVENYRPHISVDLEWPKVELAKFCTVVRGSSPRPRSDPRYYNGPIPRLMIADITRDGMYVTPKIDSLTKEGAARSRPMNQGDLVIAVSGNPGLPTILAVNACIHDGFVGLRDLDESVDPVYLYYSLLSQHSVNGLQSVGAIFRNLTTAQVREFQIPLPPTSIQRSIANELEAERAIVDANRELVKRMEARIAAAIGRVWETPVKA